MCLATLKEQLLRRKIFRIQRVHVSGKDKGFVNGLLLIKLRQSIFILQKKVESVFCASFLIFHRTIFPHLY